jgi:predicted metal-binding membrane protein
MALEAPNGPARSPEARLFLREDKLVAVALAALVLLAWLATLVGAGTGMDPAAMSGVLMPFALPASSSAWTPLYGLIAFFMWAVMMVAMMLPSASPMILLYARVIRQAESGGKARHASASIAAFASGYLALWSLFSLFAVAVQFGLERAGLLSAMMNSRSALLSGALLFAAGLYQLTPLKSACLNHCRGPAAFIAAHWRPDVVGALRMGLAHGAYCVGCCAALMLLLFAGGIMNLVWIAGLALLVALEKLAPFGAVAAKAIAVLLIGAGATLIAAGT